MQEENNVAMSSRYVLLVVKNCEWNTFDFIATTIDIYAQQINIKAL